MDGIRVRGLALCRIRATVLGLSVGLRNFRNAFEFPPDHPNGLVVDPQPLGHLAIAALRCLPKLLGYQFPLLMPAREVQLPRISSAI